MRNVDVDVGVCARGRACEGFALKAELSEGTEEGLVKRGTLKGLSPCLRVSVVDV